MSKRTIAESNWKTVERVKGIGSRVQGEGYRENTIKIIEKQRVENKIRTYSEITESRESDNR